MKRWFKFLVVAATVQMLAAATLAVVHSPAVAWDKNYEDNPGAPAEGGDPDGPSGGLVDQYPGDQLSRWMELPMRIAARLRLLSISWDFRDKIGQTEIKSWR